MYTFLLTCRFKTFSSFRNLNMYICAIVGSWVVLLTIINNIYKGQPFFNSVVLFLQKLCRACAGRDNK